MTEEELTRYIVDKLGDDGHNICMSNSKTLNARYRWLGEKSFTIDPENERAPYLLLDGAFLLFALEPSLERLRFIQRLSEMVTIPNWISSLIILIHPSVARWQNAVDLRIWIFWFVIKVG